MHELTDTPTRPRREAGFTLIEVVVTVAILGIIAAGLAGVVMSYLKNTLATSGQLNETHDVLFASAYWQRDVASLGVRSTTYNSDPSVHSFPLVTSVNTATACSLPSGTTVITLAWSEYADPANPDTQHTVTVSYVAQTGADGYQLRRVRCTGSTVNSNVVLAKQLNGVPTVDCSGGGVTGCDDATGSVPQIVKMTLSTVDANSNAGTPYTVTLTGERRQT